MSSIDGNSNQFGAWIIIIGMFGLAIHQFFAGFDRSPKIIIDDEGLHLPGPRKGSRPWEEVAYAYVEEQHRRYGTTYLIHIELADPEGKKGEESDPEEIVFRCDSYDMKPDDIVDAIMRKRSGLPLATGHEEDLAEEGA